MRSDPSPTAVGRRGWASSLRRSKSQINNLNLALLAAGVAFWALVSIFPALIATITIYGIVASPNQAAHQVNSLLGSLSPDTRKVIASWLSGITRTSGGGLTLGLGLSLAGTVWAVSSGVQTLIKAVTAAYEQQEYRGPIVLRALALVLSVGAIVVAALAIAAIGAAPAIDHLVPRGPLQPLAAIGRWVLLAAVVFGALSVLYRVAPAHSPADWRWASTGAVLATVLLIVASIGFSFYVRYFGHYNKTYGALGGVIILMLWLYYAAYVVLLGALINAETRRQVSGATNAQAYPRTAPDTVKNAGPRSR